MSDDDVRLVRDRRTGKVSESGCVWQGRPNLFFCSDRMTGTTSSKGHEAGC